MCENHFAAIFILFEGIHDRRIRKASVIGGMIRKNPSPDTFGRYGTIMKPVDTAKLLCIR